MLSNWRKFQIFVRATVADHYFSKIYPFITLGWIPKNAPQQQNFYKPAYRLSDELRLLSESIKYEFYFGIFFTTCSLSNSYNGVEMLKNVCK